MKQVLPIAALVLATACTPSAPAVVTDPVPTGLDDTCDAARYGFVVGQDATALERILILGQVRVIRPGSVVTQDYRPERINFEVGDTGAIRRITCG